MLRAIILVVLSFCTVHLMAQNMDPVSWTYIINPTTTDHQYELTITADIDGDWVVYSQHTDPDGPVPTSFTYNDGAHLLGATQEMTSPIKAYSDLFEVEVVKFKKEAIFRQTFMDDDGAVSIDGAIRYMTCDGLRCLPPKTIEFTAAL